MKKMFLVVLMLLVAGTAYAATSHKTVKCEVKGKTKWVKTVSACKDAGGKVIEVRKETKR
jgi:hypothetical protein